MRRNYVKVHVLPKFQACLLNLTELRIIIEECGLYTVVKIRGQRALLLVDTDATVTLGSEILYRNLPMSYM